MGSPIVKHSVAVSGQKTSISLEEEFWKSLREIARQGRKTVSELVGEIDAERNLANLSSAVRMFILGHYRDLVEKQIVETSSRGLEHSIEYRG